MTLTCALIDDEPLALDLLENYTLKTPFLKLNGRYGSAIEAMEKLPENPVDLLFLDIQMPELDGLQFSKIVPANTRVIFTTAFVQYALEGYRVNALDYLLKPISYQQFLEASQKALNWFINTRKAKSEDEPASLYIKSEHKLIRVKLADILYIESYKDYVRIYTSTSEKPVYTLTSLKTLEEKLPSGPFLRVHRSYIVRTDKIRQIESEYILVGTKHVPLSKNYKKELQNYLENRIL